MNGDHHYENQLLAPQWAKKCDHCGKLMHRGYSRRFGSNACRQAAYRARVKRYDVDPDRGRDRGGSRNGVTAPLKTHAPPSAEKAPPAKHVSAGKRFRGRQKGGAA